MHKLKRGSLFAATFALALATGVASADTLSASLYSPLPPSGGVLTPVVVQGITAPSQGTITGAGYTVTFNTPANQGIVNGNLGGIHAIPVAGVNGTTPLYLTGDYGSALTADPAASGNYLSTGKGGTITVTFDTPQRSLALLWGSIDTGNSISFNNADNFVITGSAVQKAAAGFHSNGYQGPGGSAYVVFDSSTPFTTIVASSSVVSFEFDAVAGDTVTFTPEPASLALFGVGALLLGLGALRRKNNNNANS